jgi:hypothetical protein
MLPAVLLRYYAVTAGGSLGHPQRFFCVCLTDKHLILDDPDFHTSGAIRRDHLGVEIWCPLDEVLTAESAVHIGAVFHAVLVPLVVNLDFRVHDLFVTYQLTISQAECTVNLTTGVE